MKVTYNWLKDFVDIKIPAKTLADKLTMAGLEVTSLEAKDKDYVFEIEVTTNRPDCLSVIGIAREVAAITDKKLKLSKLVHGPQTTVHSKRKDKNFYGLSTMDYGRLSVNIEDKKDCPLYTAKIIRDVKVGPSPDWLKKRLELVGCRSVNNIVDITNYVLFEYGEPLHAFDLDKLALGFSGSRVLPLEIIVRRAKNGEEITTIDGIKRVLNGEILIIASKREKLTNSRTHELENKPIAIAGVMGGKDTEVTESTKNILLEAAVFNPIVVRRARQALGLVSESAYRFERGVDLEIVENASLATVNLIQELASGRCVLVKSSGKPKTKKKSINLNVPTVNKILGIEIAPSKIKKILNSLSLKTNPVRNTKSPRKKNKISKGAKTKSRNNLRVEIPSHRPDVNLEIDLIEEITRIFGYEFIPKTLPQVLPQVEVGRMRDLVSLTKNILIGLGLNEVITYSLIDKDLLRSFKRAGEPEAIEILNPLSKEQAILRSKLIPSLAACVAYNLNQKQDYISIFEVAKVFLESRNLPKEELVLGITLCGVKSYVFEQGLIKEEVGFLHLKGILEVLFERLGIKDYNFNTKDEPFAVTIYVNQEKIGLMKRLQKDTLDKLNIKNKDVFVLELSLDKVLSYADLKKKYVPPPKYPGITRDISFILRDDISIKETLEAMKEKGPPLLRTITIADYYKGKQIPSGYRGLTISCLYRSDERTLIEAEINPLHNLICSILTEQFGAKIR